MQPKEMHDFLFKLFDFATTDLLEIKPEDYKSGFLMMIYIEDFMDVYGRDLIFQSANNAGLDATESLKNAHIRLDSLRAALGTTNKNKEIHAMVDEAARRIKRNYGTSD